ncbi:MAG: glycosyl transferase family 2 [Rhodocyclales bacterium]|nr:glycosyl transferase family 2 [Rhodocyclales bacterium]
MTEQRVSIVVLTYNRREEVLCTLAALTALPEQLPVLLVDNASHDGTAEAVLERFPQVVVIRNPHNAGAAGRNLGLDKATTPYVAFSDDDTVWDAGSLGKAADILDKYNNVAVISAHVLIGTARRDDPACRPMADSPFDSQGLPGKALLGFMAGACVVRVAAFREVGGYMPELFIGGEEAPLALDLVALGWRIVYCADIRTCHFPSQQRDVPQRRWLLLRNALWTAWLRLPVRLALGETLALVPLLRREHSLLKVGLQTLRKTPWLLLNRHVVPAPVQAMWRQIHRGPETNVGTPRSQTGN